MPSRAEQKDQLKPDRSTATAGSTVTIKVADGVTADDIKVVDKNGKLVEIKKIDDNTYTFVMPASDVNVSGTVEDLRHTTADSNSPRRSESRTACHAA